MNHKTTKRFFHWLAAVVGVVVVSALMVMADDAPVFQSPIRSSNQIQFTLTGATGTLYAIQFVTNLSLSNWSPVKIDAAAIQVRESATNAQRFYRGKTLTNTSVSFANSVQPIFTASCSTIGCHTGTQPAVGLNLSVGKAYAQIVNVPSVQCSDGRKRVLPGQPGQSYLLDKILGINLCSGGRMPTVPMPSAQIETIAEWIFEGAPNN